MRTPFLLSLFILTHAQRPDEGSCYFPNGTYTRDQHPCDPYAFTSLCCPTGWTCFSNRLCIITSASTATTDDPVGTTIRGTCTDPNWNGPTCGDFCLSGDGIGALTPCGDGRWCCSSDAASGDCNCTSGNWTFAVPSGQALAVIATIDSLYTVLTGTTIPTSTGRIVEPSSLATASSLSALSSLSISSASSTSSSLFTPTTLAPSKATARPSSPIPSAAPTTSPAAQSAPVTAHPSPLTLGLSISFGVLALGLLAALIWYYLRSRRARAPHPNPDTYMGPHRHPSYLAPPDRHFSPPPIGPPAPPAPVPHPYHTGRNGAARMEVPERGLSQIRQDRDGLPLVDPYAAAARRANQGVRREGGTVSDGWGHRG